MGLRASSRFSKYARHRVLRVVRGTSNHCVKSVFGIFRFNNVQNYVTKILLDSEHNQGETRHSVDYVLRGTATTQLYGGLINQSKMRAECGTGVCEIIEMLGSRLRKY